MPTKRTPPPSKVNKSRIQLDKEFYALCTKKLLESARNEVNNRSNNNDGPQQVENQDAADRRARGRRRSRPSESEGTMPTQSTRRSRSRSNQRPNKSNRETETQEAADFLLESNTTTNDRNHTLDLSQSSDDTRYLSFSQDGQDILPSNQLILENEKDCVMTSTQNQNGPAGDSDQPMIFSDMAETNGGADFPVTRKQQQPPPTQIDLIPVGLRTNAQYSIRI